jgi:hypothetical protein
MGDDQDGKDDDDDNDDDDDEKLPVGKEIDPERLKAFNVSYLKNVLTVISFPFYRTSNSLFRLR